MAFDFRELILKFEKGESVKYISESAISAKCFYIALLSLKEKLAVITQENPEKIKYEIETFSKNLFKKNLKVLHFPAYKSSYENISPHQETEIERIKTLWNMVEGNFNVVILSPETLITKIISPLNLIDISKDLKKGEKVNFQDVIAILTSYGYVREEKVFEKGEFSKRGGIIDFFPPQEEMPLRIEFFGDEIESIRYFDTGTQLSTGEINSATILPTSQFFLNENERKKFIDFLKENFRDEKFSEHLYFIIKELEAGENPPGVEYLIKKFKNHSSSILEYFEDEITLSIFSEGFYGKIREEFLKEEREKYEENIFKGIPVFSLEDNYISPSEIEEFIARKRRIIFSLLRNDETPFKRFIKRSLNPVNLLRELKNEKRAVFIFTSNGFSKKNLIKLLEEYEIPHTDNLKKVEKGIFYTLDGTISESFYFLNDFLFLSENEFFGKKDEVTISKKRNVRRLSTLISDYKNLKDGDYIVHAIYGVGIFRGIKEVSVGNITKEVVEIEYRDGDKVLVPVERFDLIYKHNLENKPTVEKLGSKNWEKVKKRIKKGIREMAGELIKLYAEREISKGFAFPKDSDFEREFENYFEFEETPDQIRTIGEVKADMEKEKPMERLVCGDVGFGKTEVAMRAAFKAVMAGKQVAFLTPTTVLSFQHYRTFKKRFQNFPINIEFLSRFKTKKEQREIIEKLKSGEIDIIIGTHRLLSKDVTFNDLGLLVIDEEQRFGVRHKEKIKMLNKRIDVLYLSATPIPRTLYMALSGIRNISVIETPPVNRLAIQTHISPFSPEIIENGIRNELKRGGQVFFVHNRIYDIFEMANYIQTLVPDAKIAVAHAKMNEKELEEVMINFINKKYDVLITTTIIENGIDMPNVNTIFINDAHKFGLAQLYQLRGRVGRSDVPAYAYLLSPPINQLTDKAKERLLALKDLNELGSGFKLASLDMKLRGAGNVLGPQQHGFLDVVGFELYCKWLANEIEKIRGNREFLSEEIEISLGIKMDIPKDYIPEKGERIKLYKEISSAESQEEIEELKKRIKDQYGKFPETFSYLFDFTLIRILMQKKGIITLKRVGDKLKFKFSQDTPVKPERIMSILNIYESSTFSPEGILTIKKKLEGKKEYFEFIKEILNRM